jgi:hypothetical protein
MRWDDLDWPILDRLREGFLSGAAARGPYWQTGADLAQYDATYGERIGWKWDAVLGELRRRGWSPPAPPEPDRGLIVADWGCGSGIAGRRVIAAFGPERVGTLQVHDHSSLAREFAARRAREQFPHLQTAELRPESPIDLLVVSHVLNELSAESRRQLRETLDRARAILWVEPGTHSVSRDLATWREQLRPTFSVIAPCTHAAACGMLAPENAQHWCHAFAPPPSGIYADSDWVKFGQRAGIDLRSLPYCFLALGRTPRAGQAPSDGLTTARIIGDARHYKGYAKVLSCEASGLADLTLQKRDAPDLFKTLKRGPSLPIYRWRREGDRIKEATAPYPETTDAG